MKFRHLPLLVLLLLPLSSARAEQLHLRSTVPVLMLSDIHLDPFHDPAKLPQLRSAPASAWAAILNGTPSPTQAADFAHLQSACGVKAIDTPIARLATALRAAQKQPPAPLYVTGTGDLHAHELNCRFHLLAPGSTAADYTGFAIKTAAFIALQLHLAFPHSPIYFALGNNDSGCDDYHEDPDSSFLRAGAVSFAADALNPANRSAILSQFPQLGDYNIALPAPIQHTRLIVLQDIFQSAKYSACSGSGAASPNPAEPPAQAQIAWLRAQLTAARAAHEHVWIMTHIPPGIDPYSTIAKLRDVCIGQMPVMFLSSDALADTLTSFPGTIRFAILAHTHMDEMRAFTAPNGETIPGKLVSSITPVNGNNPSFTLAEVEPSTAIVKDYTVYSAYNSGDGADKWSNDNTTWSKEYRFSTTYNLPDFSGASLAKLTSGFVKDKFSIDDASRAYEHLYFVGDPGMDDRFKAAALKVVWPGYACSVSHTHIATFRSCVCPASIP